jgi:hypothetical protein
MPALLRAYFLKYIFRNQNIIKVAKILSFPKGYFKRNRQRPLTPLMIRTLKIACDKQCKGVLFGPQDIKGSVTTLINRGLIACHSTVDKNGYQFTWYVTQQAINMLEEVGVKISS